MAFKSIHLLLIIFIPFISSAHRNVIEEDNLKRQKSKIEPIAFSCNKAIWSYEKFNPGKKDDNQDINRQTIFSGDPGLRKIKDSNITILRATGTGRTTGHIANLTVSNSGNEPVKLCFSSKNSCPDDATYIGMMYVPNKKYQNYVVTGPIDFVIPPSTTFVIPVTGVCVQPDKKPVPEGVSFSNPDTWIIQSDPPENFSHDGVVIDPDSPGTVVTNVPDVWPSISIPTGNGITVDPGKNPDLTASLVFDAIEKIDSTIKDLTSQGNYDAWPIGHDPSFASSIIRLYTTWFYVGTLTGQDYTFDDFTAGVSSQIESLDPQVTTDPVDIKEETVIIWDMIQLTGIEAKIISKSPDSLPSTIPK